jgi:hypothetical protein
MYANFVRSTSYNIPITRSQLVAPEAPNHTSPRLAPHRSSRSHAAPCGSTLATRTLQPTPRPTIPQSQPQPQLFENPRYITTQWTPDPRTRTKTTAVTSEEAMEDVEGEDKETREEEEVGHRERLRNVRQERRFLIWQSGRIRLLR